MPPTRLKATTFREFDLVVARHADGTVEAVAYDKNVKAIASARDVDPDVAEAEVRKRVLPLSADFFGYDSAINSFLKAFPGGFQDAYYLHRERNYKEADRDRIRTLFEPEDIAQLATEPDYTTISQRFLRALQRSNLVATQEIMAVRNTIEAPAAASRLGQAVAGIHEDVERFIDETAAALQDHGGAKWPVVTYLPFFLFSERHMFLKPSVTTKFAERIGRDLRYDPRPNPDTYRALLSLCSETRSELEKAGLEPRDNIDVQSFIWALAHDDYIAHAAREREQGDWGSKEG